MSTADPRKQRGWDAYPLSSQKPTYTRQIQPTVDRVVVHYVFEKNPRVHGFLQFKLMLFNGHV